MFVLRKAEDVLRGLPPGSSAETVRLGGEGDGKGFASSFCWDLSC